MIPFRAATTEDHDWVVEKTYPLGLYSLEYSFGGLYLWQDSFGVEIAEYEGYLVARAKLRAGNIRPLLFPVGGKDDEKIVNMLIRSTLEAGETPMFYSLTESRKKELEEFYPGRFTYTTERDGYEYIYTREKLATLAGKKYHSKRNMIRRFERENFGWEYEAITPENLHECIAMYRDWYENEDLDAKKGLIDEHRVMERAFVDFFRLGFSGGLIRAGGRVVAFCFGEALSDSVFVTHVEKADLRYDGAYPIINREFAANLPEHFIYVNREDDTGDEYLRQTKLSYEPEILLAKYMATPVKES